MKTLCKIDGVSYDVLVTDIEETYTYVEGANKGTALYRDRQIRDIKGVKIGHSVTFDVDKDPMILDALKDYLFKSIRPSVMLEVADNQTTISYEASYTTGTRKLLTSDELTDLNYWSSLTIVFTPMEIQISAE